MTDIEDIRKELRILNVNAMPVVVAMSIQDELPEQWRILVYKYGQARVFKLIATGYEIKDAVRILAR
jgi:hypothetical protein